jgi:RNA polymerase sigma factor (sigma-70 family)
MDATTANEATRELNDDVVKTLVASHRDFLAYVQRRVGDRALAEDILQDALVRSIDRSSEIRESAVGWFYRVLRNAIIDRARKAKTEAGRLQAFAAELETTKEDGELRDVACKCVTELADTLKPEYADALRQIDVEGMAVNAYAEKSGISASNAGVRVFRAREALRKQVIRACGTCATHGCLDCSCGESHKS